MKNLTLKQLQQAELEVLVEIDRVCTELGLTYYLAYGSLLGAVRHKGFIPWDDDIDIMMPRKDLEILVKEFNSHCSKDFKLLTHHDPGFFHPFPKVINQKTEVIEKGYKKMPGLGVWVDVFPLDFVAEDHAKSDEEFLHIEHRRMMSIYRYSTFFRKIRWIYGTFIYDDVSLKDLHGNSEEIIDELIQKNLQQTEGEKVRINYTPKGIVTIFPTEWFGEGKRIEFEGYSLLAPDNPHEVLKMLYGDYMTPPPLKDRVTGHHFKSSHFIVGDQK
jgi:LPS biosynthesis protein